MATGQNPKPRTGSPGPGSLLRDPTPSTMSNPPVVGLGGWWWCRDGRGRTCKVPENAASGARGREETLWAACASLRSGSSRLTTAHGLALRERGGLAALLYGGATCASFWFPVSPPPAPAAPGREWAAGGVSQFESRQGDEPLGPFPGLFWLFRTQEVRVGPRHTGQVSPGQQDATWGGGDLPRRRTRVRR